MTADLQKPSTKLTAWLVAAHVIATPVVTWLAIVYNTLSAPWHEVHALWHGQAVLLGVWCGISSAPPLSRLRRSLAGLFGLCAMPTLREISLRGLPKVGAPWAAYVNLGFQPLYLGLSFAAAAIALVFARTVWPRWRLVTVDDSRNARAAQFSIKGLMLGTLGCTPWLMGARLMHDHLNLFPVHDLSTALLVALLESPLAAAVGLLAAWAGLGRSYVALRLAAAVLALPLVVLLMGYATKQPPARIIGRIVFEEMQLAVALVTLLVCRWNGSRIGGPAQPQA